MPLFNRKSKPVQERQDPTQAEKMAQESLETQVERPLTPSEIVEKAIEEVKETGATEKPRHFRMKDIQDIAERQTVKSEMRGDSSQGRRFHETTQHLQSELSALEKDGEKGEEEHVIENKASALMVIQEELKIRRDLTEGDIEELAAEIANAKEAITKEYQDLKERQREAAKARTRTEIQSLTKKIREISGTSETSEPSAGAETKE